MCLSEWCLNGCTALLCFWIAGSAPTGAEMSHQTFYSLSISLSTMTTNWYAALRSSRVGGDRMNQTSYDNERRR